MDSSPTRKRRGWMRNTPAEKVRMPAGHAPHYAPRMDRIMIADHISRHTQRCRMELMTYVTAGHDRFPRLLPVAAQGRTRNFAAAVMDSITGC